jgi:hypothetical protein
MSIKHNIALFLSREYNKDMKAIAIKILALFTARSLLLYFVMSKEFGLKYKNSTSARETHSNKSREYNKDMKAIAIWKELFKTKYRAQMTAIEFLIKK